MKKIVTMLFALALGFSVTVHAADAEVGAKEKEAKELRIQAIKAQMQADSLLKRAIEIERQIIADESKQGEKMRGYGSSSCVSDCISSKGYVDLYSCRRACGSY